MQCNILSSLPCRGNFTFVFTKAKISNAIFQGNYLNYMELGDISALIYLVKRQVIPYTMDIDQFAGGSAEMSDKCWREVMDDIRLKDGSLTLMLITQGNRIVRV